MVGQAICGAARASNPCGFTGALNAGTDGQPLCVMGARLYAPSMGAFTSMDTYAGKSANPLSMNRFLYTEGDPTTLVDPTGHNAIYEGGDCGPNGVDCGHDAGVGDSAKAAWRDRSGR